MSLHHYRSFCCVHFRNFFKAKIVRTGDMWKRSKRHATFMHGKCTIEIFICRYVANKETSSWNANRGLFFALKCLVSEITLTLCWITTLFWSRKVFSRINRTALSWIYAHISNFVPKMRPLFLHHSCNIKVVCSWHLKRNSQQESETTDIIVT